MARARIPEETRDRFCEMYLAGVSMSQIERETGHLRGSIYPVLEERGIKPNRATPKTAAQDATVARLDAIMERTLTLLQSELEMKNKLIDQLMAALATSQIRFELPPDVADKLRGGQEAAAKPARSRRAS